MKIDIASHRWPLNEPFEIARGVEFDVELVEVTLTDSQGRVGRGEAAGVDYEGETGESMMVQLEAARPALSDSLTFDDVQSLLPKGGARNALDCALWDLASKRAGRAVADLAGLPPLKPLVTAFTIGLGSLAQTAERARRVQDFPLIKIKLDATRHIDRVKCVRDAAPQAELIVDANQAWDRALLEKLLPRLEAEGVTLIEQPLETGRDADLAGLESPIPVGADESLTDMASFAAIAPFYQVINIKLDKCGGLTEALRLASAARAAGMEIMVGNMLGTSLGMAPAFLVAQQARWADLDGPLLLAGDRLHAMQFHLGIVQSPPPALWGEAE
ncbi:N-acetyl-D-Glu racemase DgcA [Sphingorhabdus sp.]|jgi:L-alanine-DL-glutamate epimerase-like enolase superfamily enzyme|uniref:N-acetyl-D-Glu racemase DgcA n=1 Tax=Sphingorhabdus sp. TaxID=1902408 RepID=UPI0037CC71A9